MPCLVPFCHSQEGSPENGLLATQLSRPVRDLRIIFTPVSPSNNPTFSVASFDGATVLDASSSTLGMIFLRLGIPLT